jgi:hypothetical protein
MRSPLDHAQQEAAWQAAIAARKTVGIPYGLDAPQDKDLLIYDAASGKWTNTSFLTLFATNISADGGTSSTPPSDFDIAVDFGGSS